MILARVGALVAAIAWLVGAPLVGLSGVTPSDAEYFWGGTVGALVGVALMPVIASMRHPASATLTSAIRISGWVACTVLVLSGILLALAAGGKLGARAPNWIPAAALIGFTALFLWIGLASSALRGASTVERAIFWLGILTAASFLMPGLASVLLFKVARGFVVTNLTILPLLVADVLLWVSLPAWLAAVIVRIWPRWVPQRTLTGRPS